MKNSEGRLLDLIKDLYPICRSITGEGVRESLQIISNIIPLKTYEIPTGSPVFDWEVPKEWNINDAWIKNSDGKKIVDFKKSNLHVLNYSIPVDRTVSFDELKDHLYSDPAHPWEIPYRTSYYKEQWGFCVSQQQLSELDTSDTYHVYIDSTLADGSLTLGELYIEGKTEQEMLISAHICHPSLCNDNLSGVAVAVFLAEYLLQKELTYSYRFLFIPGTIGSITWLSLNEDILPNIKQGLVLSCVGDDGNMTYKKTRQGDADIDKIMEKVLVESGAEYEVRNFSPYGYDERQYCSPGINLPVGCFMRTPFGEFPEYHTSADNLTFVKPAALADSLSTLKKVIEIIEQNGTYQNLNPKCEPNLGSRGLYSMTGGKTHSVINQLAVLWVLNYSDGTHSLLDIAALSGLRFKQIRKAADALEEVNLLESIDEAVYDSMVEPDLCHKVE